MAVYHVCKNVGAGGPPFGVIEVQTWPFVLLARTYRQILIKLPLSGEGTTPYNW